VFRDNVEHFSPFNSKVKTEWSYTAAPLVCHNGVIRGMVFHHFLTDKYLDHFWNWYNFSITLKTRLDETMLQAFFIITTDALDLHSLWILGEKFWLIVQEAAAATFCYFFHHLPPEVHFLQSHQLHPLFLHYFLPCVYLIYSSLLLFCKISCSSSPIKYVSPTIMSVVEHFHPCYTIHIALNTQKWDFISIQDEGQC